MVAAAGEDSTAGNQRTTIECPPVSRSRLHNFSFPTLSWGSQKLLRSANLPARSDGLDPIPNSPPLTSSPAKADEDGGEPLSSLPEAAAVPWNLRTRRAPGETEQRRPASSPVASPQKPERPLKFSVQLPKTEIEEDFLVMRGTKPPRRPKKRVKSIQKQLDSLFPGLWLSDITLDSYKTAD